MTEFSNKNAAPTTNATNNMLGYLRNNQRATNGNNGIYSVCSAHPLVIEAACVTANWDQSTVAIEATCNQVNQEGGYTGMRPKDFVDLVYGIADKVGLPWEQVVLGGDHLGPAPWYKKYTAAEAMDKACAMVDEYVAAGFRKIHLDASFLCKDDPRDDWGGGGGGGRDMTQERPRDDPGMTRGMTQRWPRDDPGTTRGMTGPAAAAAAAAKG
jgi:hypothetical protein